MTGTSWWRAAMIVCLTPALALAGGQGRAAAQTAGPALVSIGFDHFYNLEYPAAISTFQKEARLTPSDPAAWDHLAQGELYQEMYRVGALASQLFGHGNPFLKTTLLPTDPEVVRRFLEANQKALALADAQLATQPDNAELCYDRAVAWGLRGTFDFVLRKAYWAALGDATKARHDATRAVALRPGWHDPELILGVNNYIVGSLPWAVRLLAHLSGFSGSKQAGIAEIRDVAVHSGGASTEAKVLLVVVDRREGWNQLAVPWLAELRREYPRNVLFAVELAEANEAAGAHEQAIAAYRDVIERARAGAPGYERAPLDKVWYDLGTIDRLFSRYPQALADYQQVEQAPRAEWRYRQAAALGAGQMEDLLSQRAAARTSYQRCIAINPDGAAAHAARSYLNRPYHF